MSLALPTALDAFPPASPTVSPAESAVSPIVSLALPAASDALPPASPAVSKAESAARFAESAAPSEPSFVSADVNGAAAVWPVPEATLPSPPATPLTVSARPPPRVPTWMPWYVVSCVFVLLQEYQGRRWYDVV